MLTIKTKKLSCALVVLVVCSLGTQPSAIAQSSVDYLPEVFQDNLRFAIDTAVRDTYSDEADTFYEKAFLGFDLHKVFSGSVGDIGTLILQGYLTYIPDQEIRPAFFTSETDFIFRIFNFNYRVLPRGRMNLRIGHFELPFGLEHSVNTNGTLLDYTSGRNLGVKADWGASVNGELAWGEYELAITRGSGNDWETKGDPVIFSGRLGTRSSQNWTLGASVMSGDVFSPAAADHIIERDRLGLDAQWYRGPWGVLAEASLGDDDGQDVRSGLAEINLSSPDRNLVGYAQYLYQSQQFDNTGWEKAKTLKLGIKWNLSQRWDLSAQLQHELSVFFNGREDDSATVQARFRF